MTRSVAGLAAMLVLVLGAAAPPAQAADELGLSPDGRTWSAGLPGPLFDPKVRWVPGDARRADFYVRNQAADGGTLTVAVQTQDPDRLLGAKDIRLSARVGSDGWVDLAPGGQAFRLNDATLPADAIRKVTVKARFDPTSGNRSQRKSVALSFRVTLVDAASDPNPDPDVSDETGEPSDLPDAGAPAVGWFLVAGGVAIGVGLALIKRRRREESAHGTTS